MTTAPTKLTPEQLFFERTGIDQSRTQARIADALSGTDDGELYLEYEQSESLTFDDSSLRSARFDTRQGFGLRAVAGEATAYAHASELSDNAVVRAASAVQAVKAGHTGKWADAPRGTNVKMYDDRSPIDAKPFGDKVELLREIDAHARALDPRIKQVSISLEGTWKSIMIMRPDGRLVTDQRPAAQLIVSVTVEQNNRMESGYFGTGGRADFASFLDAASWQHIVSEARRKAITHLEAVPAPAGEMTVVLGPGSPGVLLHEAVGHGLEGDFNRKGTSAFADLLGERVAAPGVTVVDDGTIFGRRGSLTMDDEGTGTQQTVLIEDGILKGYMQDRLNARLMGVEATGNGRRESYAYEPMPRMTNTYMLSGDRDPQEIIEGVQNGIYAPDFGSGEVDITNGKFVFNCDEAYLIENGKVTAPIKGASLIGSGPDVLTRITAIGNDLKLDSDIGHCGKGDQMVPVGLGQPTLQINGVTVGGTQT